MVQLEMELSVWWTGDACWLQSIALQVPEVSGAETAASQRVFLVQF
jgi:hypothetical protein